MRVGLHSFWLVTWLFLSSVGQGVLYAQNHANKVALVIGNTGYTKLPRLKNASNDALAVARALSDKGFTVFFAKDVDAARMKDILVFVSGQSVNADQIMIYYAGHSEIQNGITQLLPIDSDGYSGRSASQSLSVPDLLNLFDLPFAQKAFILDACLQDPPGLNGSGTPSLSLPKTLGMETLLVFATSFGQAAYDGSGNHSVFTGALLDHLTKDNLDLQSTVQSVRKEVIQSSRASQIPVSASTLTRPYILHPHGRFEQNFKVQNDLVQSYSSSGYAGKPLLGIISQGIIPSDF